MKLKLVNIVFLVGILSLFFNHSLPDRQSGTTKIALNDDQMSLIEGKGCTGLEAASAVVSTAFCVIFWFEATECAVAAVEDVGCLLPDDDPSTGGPTYQFTSDGNGPLPMTND